MQARDSTKVGLAVVASLAAAPLRGGPVPGRVGDGCQPRAADRDKGDLAFDKGIFNFSTSAAARVFCPIETTDHGLIAETGRTAYLYVIDNNSSTDFNCKVVFTVGAATTGVFSLIKNVDLEHNPVSGPKPGLGSPKVFYDSIHINCTIPPKTAAGRLPS